MKIETSMTSDVCKNSGPYFQCVHHHLVPGKHPQRHWYNSKLNSWYWQLRLVYIPDTGMVFGFFWIFFIFVPGTHFYRKQTKYTTPARVPGLPIRDCARGCNNRAQMCSQLSAISVTAKTFFEHLYLVLGLRKIAPWVNCPYAPTTLTHSLYN
jgi:hypothetical protein